MEMILAYSIKNNYKMKNLKHIFLLLLLSFTTINAQSRSEIQTQIETIATGVPNTALKIRNVLGVLADGTAQTGDIKEIDVSNAYLTANFDVTGLGKNERLGWAICNGNNGTRNRSGRVSVPYDASNYPTLGATGGSNSVTLIKNNIPILDSSFPTSNADQGGGTRIYVMATDTEPAGSKTYVNSVNTASTNTPVDIRQQYIVSLFIMKL